MSASHVDLYKCCCQLHEWLSGSRKRTRSRSLETEQDEKHDVKNSIPRGTRPTQLGYANAMHAKQLYEYQLMIHLYTGSLTYNAADDGEFYTCVSMTALANKISVNGHCESGQLKLLLYP